MMMKDSTLSTHNLSCLVVVQVQVSGFWWKEALAMAKPHWQSKKYILANNKPSPNKETAM